MNNQNVIPLEKKITGKLPELSKHWVAYIQELSEKA